jgi:hypothetical protein
MLKFFDADPESFEPGSGMEKFGSGRIRNTAVNTMLSVLVNPSIIRLG